MGERDNSSFTVSNDKKGIIEMYYRRIFDDMNEGALIFGFTGSGSSKDGMIIYSNKGFGKLVKRAMPKVIGASIFDFIPDEDIQIVKEMLAEISSGQAQQREIHLKGDDGELVDVNFSISSMLKKAVIYAIITDLTEIKKKERESRRLAAECLIAQEKERKRIAGELHDGLSADLSALKMALENKLDSMINSKPSNVRIEDLIAQLKMNIEELRRIMTSLHPLILDDLGIIATINWYCREYQKTYPHIHVELQVSVNDNEVSASLKTAIYRICQESLNNVAKHSKANLVILSLQKIDKKIELTIKDNGQGFNLSKKPKRKDLEKGFGLDSMRERAEILGGSLSIASSVGSGTTIHAIWPI